MLSYACDRAIELWARTLLLVENVWTTVKWRTRTFGITDPNKRERHAQIINWCCVTRRQLRCYVWYAAYLNSLALHEEAYKAYTRETGLKIDRLNSFIRGTVISRPGCVQVICDWMHAFVLGSTSLDFGTFAKARTQAVVNQVGIIPLIRVGS